MNPFNHFERKIQLEFKNKKLLENVFVHRSYLNENKRFPLPANEKLEFLGDSVLSLITSMYLYRFYPQLQEGEYTEIKSAIVRTESLAEAAKRVGIGDYLLLSKGQDREKGRSNKNILADTFEALIAAIFIDRGFNAAYSFVLKNLFDGRLEQIVDHKLYLSPKSRLQEYSQSRFKVTPTYEVVEERGPEHLRTYKIVVKIGAKRYATGLGNSKKEAEESAAKTVLAKLKIV